MSKLHGSHRARVQFSAAASRARRRHQFARRRCLGWPRESQANGLEALTASAATAALHEFGSWRVTAGAATVRSNRRDSHPPNRQRDE